MVLQDLATDTMYVLRIYHHLRVLVPIQQQFANTTAVFTEFALLGPYSGSGCMMRERELRRNYLLAYVNGRGPLPNTIERPTNIRSLEHISGWVTYPPADVMSCYDA